MFYSICRFVKPCAPSFPPVDDAFAMQEHESRSDLGGVETGSRLFKLPGLLDVEHKIAAIHKLHHKEETVLVREGRTEGRKEGDGISMCERKPQ